MKIILNGGGSGEQVKESYEVFVREVNGGNVIYIPLAWSCGNMEDCIDWFADQMLPFGVNKIEQILDPNDITKEKLEQCQAVFIGGGNTYQLLKSLKETHAFDNLRNYLDNGGLIMGASAGALIFGETIDTCLKDNFAIDCCDDENLVGLNDTNGYNLLFGFSILPHYKKIPEQMDNVKNRVNKLLKQGRKVICLPEETSLWISGDQWTVIGQRPAEIFESNNTKIVQPGESICLEKF